MRTFRVAANIIDMAQVDLNLLPLTGIDKVTFYKRDEITTDLICCELLFGDTTWSFHEEFVGWDSLIEHLSRLPGFLADWFAQVSQPPFETSEIVAFTRR